MYFNLLNDQQTLLDQSPSENKGVYNPYKWDGVKTFTAKFKSGGLAVNQDLKNAKGDIAHKGKYAGPGLQAGDKWECVTSNKDHEQTYWHKAAALDSINGTLKVSGKIDKEGTKNAACAITAGAQDVAGFQVSSHAQVECEMKPGQEKAFYVNWCENMKQGENNFGFNLWFNSIKNDKQKVANVMSADIQAANIGKDNCFWAKLRALDDSDLFVGTQMKHNLGKAAVEASYTWQKDALNNSKLVHGFFGIPLSVRVASTWNVAPGVTWNSLQSFGKECKSVEKLDVQATSNTKVTLGLVSDLKQWKTPGSMLQQAAVNLEVKL